MSAPHGIRIRHGAKRLELTYDDGSNLSFSAEILRVLVPDPAGKAGLVVGKEQVRLVSLVPVGNYALRLKFSDGFESSAYSWAFLHELGREQAIRWRRYLRLLQDAGLSRAEPGLSPD